MSNPSGASPETLPKLEALSRLGKNVNGYLGERIDISAVLRDCVLAARSQGWNVEELPAGTHLGLWAFTRLSSSSRPPEKLAAPVHVQRVYVSTGIHGDEPAGPLAIRQLLQENAWPEHLDLWVCPCLNPAGFAESRRENPQGLDLNRQYLNPTAPETVAHIQWLARQPAFDLSICVHEDWESSGFYVYELNPDGRPSLAERIVERVARVCPIDQSDLIEGRPARNGIIRPSLDPRSRPDWPEAFFLITHKSRLSYTLEAPSDFPLRTRVAALTAGVRAALEGCGEAH